MDHGNLRGVGIQKIEQISSSMDSLGANVIRVTLDDGSFYDYTVRNGDRGPAGSLWIGTSEPPDDSYSLWLNQSGMVSGYVGANQGAENAGRVLAVGEDGVVIPREETPYTLPQASPDALGGVKADAAETADTQPVRKGTDGKLYTAPGVGTSIGITGASAGQIPKVKAVDESGAPTEWKAEKDTTPFIVTVGGDQSSGYTSSHTFDEIVAAASAGRVVMAYSDYINFPQVGKSLYGVYFNLDSTQDVAVFVYIDPWNMIKYTFAVDPFSISASASYLSATSSTFGGVKADSAEATDTQPVRIGGDGKLYTAPGGGGADISLGISGATAGQVAKVKTVDASGVPTAWEAGDAASGGSEWTKLGDVTVSQTAEFVPLSFSNGIVTIDTNADGYASLPSSGTIGCIVHTIDVTSKTSPGVGMLKPKNYEAGTFEFYNRDSVFQSSAAYDPTTYKISIGNVAMVVLENIPTNYKRYKSRVTTPAYTNHGLRARYTCDGFTEIGCGADSTVNMVGGAIIETEFYPHPYDENYVYRRVRTAYGKFYGGGSGNEFQSFELVDSGSGKTKPQVSGIISFKVSSMIFVNGTRFELWGTNDD